MQIASRFQDCLGRRDQPTPYTASPWVPRLRFLGTLLQRVMGSSGMAGWEGPGTGRPAEPQVQRQVGCRPSAQPHKFPAPEGHGASCVQVLLETTSHPPALVRVPIA